MELAIRTNNVMTSCFTGRESNRIMDIMRPELVPVQKSEADKSDAIFKTKKDFVLNINDGDLQIFLWEGDSSIHVSF